MGTAVFKLLLASIAVYVGFALFPHAKLYVLSNFDKYTKAQKVYDKVFEQYSNAETQEFDVHKNLKLLEEFCCDLQPEIPFFIGLLHDENENFDEALKFYEIAASKDLSNGYHNAAIIYLNEYAQIDKAHRYFERAGELGSASAYLWLSDLWLSDDLYLNGVHFKKDKNLALKYLQKGAELNPKLNINLGDLYLDGTFDGRDGANIAIEYYKKAKAYNNAARVYFLGDKVEQNYEKAASLYKLGVENYDTEEMRLSALNSLLILRMAFGVDVSPYELEESFKKLEQKKIYKSNYWHAYLLLYPEYFKVYDLPQNIDKAYSLLLEGYQQDDKNASHLLSYLMLNAVDFDYGDKELLTAVARKNAERGSTLDKISYAMLPLSLKLDKASDSNVKNLVKLHFKSNSNLLRRLFNSNEKGIVSLPSLQAKFGKLHSLAQQGHISFKEVETAKSKLRQIKNKNDSGIIYLILGELEYHLKKENKAYDEIFENWMRASELGVPHANLYIAEHVYNTDEFNLYNPSMSDQYLNKAIANKTIGAAAILLQNQIARDTITIEKLIELAPLIEIDAQSHFDYLSLLTSAVIPVLLDEQGLEVDNISKGLCMVKLLTKHPLTQIDEDEPWQNELTNLEQLYEEALDEKVIESTNLLCGICADSNFLNCSFPF